MDEDSPSSDGSWPMPNPCDKDCLHFKGKRIDKFLSKYKCYADRARLTEVQRCEELRRYFSRRERPVLDVLEGHRNRNWSQLIEELLSLYTASSELYAWALYEEKSRWKDLGSREEGALRFRGKDMDGFRAKYAYYADGVHLPEFQKWKHIRSYFSRKEKPVLEILVERCQDGNWNQLVEELRSWYPSRTSNGAPPFMERCESQSDREARNGFEELGENNSQALESQLYAISELRSSARLCDMCGESYHDIVDCKETAFFEYMGICELDSSGQVVMCDGSALPQAEGEGGISRVLRE